MKKCFVLLNHKFDEKQVTELKDRYGVEEVVPAPEELAGRWSQIPAEGEFPFIHILPILEWLTENATEDDLVWVQGEPASVMVICALCREKKLEAVYATTRRDSVDIPQEDGSVKKVMQFKHVNFRSYPIV